MCDAVQTHAAAALSLPPMDTTNLDTRLRALRDTALTLGGQKKLAEFLGIDEWLVSRWLQGLGHPPDFLILRCTEELEIKKQAGAATSRKEPGVRGRH